MTKFLVRKILITGANGQLASAIINHPKAKQFEIHALARQELDITDSDQIRASIAEIKPDILINPAAYTAVDKAETDYDNALAINCEGAFKLALACKEHDIPLIHISTDYVFDGRSANAYSESNPPNPINAYGKSKLLGEQAIRKVYDKHIILRVSGVFSEYGNNFLKTMLKLAKEKEELNIVADQFTSPTYAGDIATALLTIAKNPVHYGIFHCCSKDKVSWHSFCNSIIQCAANKGFPVKTKLINKISSAEYQTKAKRPGNAVLNCDKIKSVYQFDAPNLNSGMEKAIDAIFQKKGSI